MTFALMDQTSVLLTTIKKPKLQISGLVFTEVLTNQQLYETSQWHKCIGQFLRLRWVRSDGLSYPVIVCSPALQKLDLLPSWRGCHSLQQPLSSKCWSCLSAWTPLEPPRCPPVWNVLNVFFVLMFSNKKDFIHFNCGGKKCQQKLFLEECDSTTSLVHCCTLSLCYLGAETDDQYFIWLGN